MLRPDTYIQRSQSAGEQEADQSVQGTQDQEALQGWLQVVASSVQVEVVLQHNHTSSSSFFCLPVSTRIIILFIISAK